MEEHRSGAIAIIGRPNAGKSTLLNSLLGQKVAIISNKPQTTRNRIVGIYTREGVQIALVDTPGMHAAKSRINRSMVRAAHAALEDVDGICWVIDSERALEKWPKGGKGISRALEHIAAAIEKTDDLPVSIALNKVDRIKKPQLLPLMAGLHARLPLADIFPMSAIKGTGVEPLLATWKGNLPVGPAMFPADQIMDGSERFLVAELIREKIFHSTNQEVPYATAVEIEKFTEEERDDNRPYIEIFAKVLVERSSQKGIIIGKGGSMLERIGTSARQEIQKLLGARVRLNLHVSVQENWSENARMLRDFGIE
jgi:GTP-binding protein Era